MSSPLRLTTFINYNKPSQTIPVQIFGSQVNIPTNFENHNFTQGIGYVSESGEDVNSPDYTGEYNSIFNNSKFYYRPTASTDNNGPNVNIRSSKRHGKISSNGKYNFISDDINDISTNSIIAYSNNEKMPALALEPSQFVYLKNYGVYPNNRLLIAKRFPSPVDNDLTSVGFSPLSTIVSWIEDGKDDFFNFEMDEGWKTNQQITDPVKEITGIFSDIFKGGIGSSLEKGIGGLGAGVAKMIPVGGIVEALETTLVNYFLRDGETGEAGSNFNYGNLHKGNPNYMGESSFRDINSITSKISIPIKVEYEMKFINGIDPTIAFMDLVQNLLRFSSSQSVFYLSQGGGKNINKFVNKFKEGKWIEAVDIVLKAVINAVQDLAGGVTDLLNTIFKVGGDIIKGQLPQENKELVKNAIKDIFSTIGKSALARYRIKFSQIIPAMTGASSAPWHISIGNPKNPFFSSGDMVVSNSKVTFGNTLGFNDIPTRMEFSFNIISARNLGIQEIFDKFNVGASRQYQRSSIQYKVDFYQGSVDNQGSGDKNQSGGEVPPSIKTTNFSNPLQTGGFGLSEIKFTQLPEVLNVWHPSGAASISTSFPSFKKFN